MDTPKESKLIAANLIAQGATQREAANRIGVSRSTIARWLTEEEFKAEVERRKQVAMQVHQERGDELIRESVDQYYQLIRDYRDARLNLYRKKLGDGINGLNKTSKRFKDLPEEAIAPTSIAQLYSTFDSMTESAMKGWAELIAINEVLMRLQDGQQNSS